MSSVHDTATCTALLCSVNSINMLETPKVATNAAYTVDYMAFDHAESKSRVRAVWRVLTAAIFHMGILHLAFNMLAFVPIGQSLERLIGTIQVLQHEQLLGALRDNIVVWT